MKLPFNFSDKCYSSKMILFGEYGVINGGDILATPLSIFSANWTLDNQYKGFKEELLKIHDYLHSQENDKIDLEKFLLAIKNGYRLESKIPTGYGLGSSGSISAAIYDKFAYEKAIDLDILKQDLIDIESCFHGISSGIDPLVIYLNKPIHINEQGIQILEQELDLNNYFLIDTHIGRKTKLLVEKYIERAKNNEYKDAIENYKTLIQKAIQSQLKNQTETLSQYISDISRWQYDNLDFAILDEHKPLWKSTLDRSDVSIKLCGAGGGGFMLGYAENVDALIEEFCGVSGKLDIIRLG